ncbi:hypothetical protein ACH42_09580 [Endozoicomonas sp. (ex Bugula neritina AB1)]|nr:hypothetical protein ACH42_09580 [Endozoicomonas sp. (ex Bugula neritina AB1)]
MKYLLVFLLLFSTVGAATECSDLTPQQASATIQSLSAEIKRHDTLYFDQHAPEISDAEYDDLTAKLKSLTQCFAQQTTERSNATPIKNQKQHIAFMGSLKKAKSEEDIKTFLKLADAQPIILQPKIDGIAVELIYTNGQLTEAITRGNGDQGTSILHHIQAMPLIPKHIDNPNNITLHGELFARLDLVETSLLNQYASARHLVAGLTSRNNVDPTSLKAIDFFPWRWISSPFDTGTNERKTLNSYGFPLPAQFSHEVISTAEIKQWLATYGTNKAHPFLLDGIVLKADNRLTQQTMGWSQDTPNYAVAWKFPPVTRTTNVLEIEFTIGRTGQITPVLILEPVNMKGERISRVSLGSINNLKEKDIAIGDQISIQLKGAATPIFNKVIFKSPHRKSPITPSQHKYSAFTCLSMNPDCEQQFKARINWLIGSKGLNWPDKNKTQINDQIMKGNIKQLQDVIRFAPKEHRVSMSAQIRALSIPDIGKSKSRRLADNLNSWREILNASEQNLIEKAGLRQSDVIPFKQYLQLPEISALISWLSKD